MEFHNSLKCVILYKTMPNYDKITVQTRSRFE
jgi:hypothetical protein